MIRSWQSFISFIFFLLLVSGCSFSKKQQLSTDPSLEGLLTVDIFYAHQLRIGAPVERFYVEDETVWHQCGKVNTGADLLAALSSDSLFFVYPNVNLTQKKEVTLDDEEQKKLRYLTLKAIEAVDTASDSFAPVKITNFSEGLLDAQLSLGQKYGFSRRSFKMVKNKEQASDQAIMDLLDAFESLKLDCNQ